MVDIHCHILPETDDGAASWDVAVAMCHAAAADGITHLVATPHANYDFHYDRARNLETLHRLQGRVGDAISLSLGCDFHLSFENLADLERRPEDYLLAEGPYLLIELSDFSIHPTMVDTVSRLVRASLKPIVTHPERNAVLQRNPQLLLGLVEAGATIQVTANALTGGWGQRAKESALRLLTSDLVAFVATDAHNLTTRPPRLSHARDLIAKLKGEFIADALVNRNPAAVLQGCSLPYQP